MAKDSTIFDRVGTRLRNASTLAYQVAQGEIADTKVTEHHPAAIRAIVKEVRGGMDLLEQYADEQEISQGHRKENADAYVTLAQSLNNAATIIGSEGQNIKILLFSDPEFIFEVLSEGQESAIEEALSKLTPELKKKYARWLVGSEVKKGEPEE